MPFVKPEVAAPLAHELALRVAAAREAGTPATGVLCNHCGRLGAEWIPSARPGWGSLALCPDHKRAWDEEMRRHNEFLARFQKVHFEQPSYAASAHAMVANRSWRERHRTQIASLAEAAKGPDTLNEIVVERREDDELDGLAYLPRYVAQYRRNPADPVPFEARGHTQQDAVSSLRHRLTQAPTHYSREFVDGLTVLVTSVPRDRGCFA